MGAGGVIALFLIIIFVVIGMVWAFSVRYDDTSHNLKEGCVPLTADRYGIPTTYSCPQGADFR